MPNVTHEKMKQQDAYEVGKILIARRLIGQSRDTILEIEHDKLGAQLTLHNIKDIKGRCMLFVDTNLDIFHTVPPVIQVRGEVSRKPAAFTSGNCQFEKNNGEALLVAMMLATSVRFYRYEELENPMTKPLNHEMF